MSTARCLVIAHRGASAARPENTVAAFHHARELGADAVELDVRRTADGVLVVHHDAHLADGRAIVETAAVDLPAAVPALTAALEACAGMDVNVEIKNAPGEPDFDAGHGVADQVAAALRACLPPERIPGLVVSSFTIDTIDRMRAVDAGLPTGWLTFDLADSAAAVALAAERGHAAIHPYDVFVDRTLVRRAHDAGLRVLVWTVDDPARMAALVDLGVDGIITNHPERGRAVVDRAGRS
jgi:glycerophosphoryl diester phosphodiesterase